MSLKDWSTTADSNTAAAPNGAPEGMTIANVNNTMRQMMADVRTLAAEDTIASATTCDLGTKDATFLTITGTTTITGFGTVSAGIYKFVKFSGALTLTHNATSLILLTGANRTTVAGDCALYKSEGSGNWREYSYFSSTTTAFGLGLLELADAAALRTSVGAASETATGVVELATSAEAVTGTDTARAVTAAGVTAAIAAYGSQSLAASGYKVLPGGLIVQWGYHASPNATTITFPIAFPAACLSVQANSDSSGSYHPYAKAITTTNFEAGGQYPGVGFGAAPAYYWLAIGY